MKGLAAFDFDHTIVEENSDTHIRTLFPNGKVPKEVSNVLKTENWTKYMAAVFDWLHSNCNVTEAELKKCILQLTVVPGMADLFQQLAGAGYDIIVVSDSNSVFINWILEEAQLSGFVSKVYTNPARFESSGKLGIEFFHTQDWCKLCSVNICKGSVVKAHMDERGVYDKVIYVGDGENDLCPSKLLKDTDTVFPRVGYKLEKTILANPEEIKATVCYWKTGHDISRRMHFP